MSMIDFVRESPKRAALIGVGGLVAVVGSCGVGSAMNENPKQAAAAPSTITRTATFTETTTVTERPRPVRRTTEPSTSTTTTTTDADVDVDDNDDRQQVRPLAPRRPRTTQPVPTADPPSAYYPNCKAARAAGAAPLHVGEPGYSGKLDGDGDGVACE